MRGIKQVIVTVGLLPLATLPSCGGPERTPDVVENHATSSDTGVVAGEVVVVKRQDGSSFQGIAVKVRQAGGDTSFAVFLGPPALARAASGGTYAFRADSLPARVRLLDQGEQMQRAIEHRR